MKLALLAALFSLPALAEVPTPPDVREVNVTGIVYKKTYQKFPDGGTKVSGEEFCRVTGKVGAYNVRPFREGFTIPSQDVIGNCQGLINGKATTLVVTGKVQIRNRAHLENHYRKFAVATVSASVEGEAKKYNIDSAAATDEERNVSLVLALSDEAPEPENYTSFERLYAEIEFSDVNQ